MAMWTCPLVLSLTSKAFIEMVFDQKSAVRLGAFLVYVIQSLLSSFGCSLWSPPEHPVGPQSCQDEEEGLPGPAAPLVALSLAMAALMARRD